MQKIQQGDLVQVIAGKEKGKRGQVLAFADDGQRVKVKGLMLVKRHLKPSQGNSSGSIVEKESTIHVSNVMLVDPKTDKPTRVRFSMVDGAKVRLASSGQKIEMPIRGLSKARD